MDELSSAAEKAVRDRLDKALKQARHLSGLSMRELSAELGKNPSYLQQHIHKGSPRRLPYEQRRVLESRLGLPDGYFNEDWSGPAIDVAAVAAPALPAPTSSAAAVTSVVPMRGIMRDRRWVFTDGPVTETVPRPPALAGSDDGYALFVLDDTAAPRYEAGDLVYVDPAAHPRPGDWVVVVGKDDGVTILRLIVKAGGLIAEAGHPPQRVSLAPADYRFAHRIVGVLHR